MRKKNQRPEELLGLRPMPGVDSQLDLANNELQQIANDSVEALSEVFHNLPLAHGIITRLYDDGDGKIEIECPYCGRIHNHGWPMNLGPEVARSKFRHCNSWDREEGDRRRQYLVSPVGPNDPRWWCHRFKPGMGRSQT